jgi:competence protein CoiA
MQLYARNASGDSLAVADAVHGCDYRCLECDGIVRVREGGRQRHYYHLRRPVTCRQYGKGIIHLQVQRHLLAALPSGEAKMEERFSSIGRVADVAWHNQHIVFEVQCAKMTPAEALARTEDYRSIGWQVIWILHQDRYRRRKVTALEENLMSIPHYFTNIDAEGRGTVYDEVAVYRHGRRIAMTRGRSIGWEAKRTVPELLCALPVAMEMRLKSWPLHLKDDYFSQLAQIACWAPLLAMEQRCEGSAIAHKGLLWRCLIRPYRLLLQYVLEAHCSR